MGLEEDFQQAAVDVKGYNITSNDDLLELYALFKQATVGDNETPKPGMLDFKGKAKWEAWKNKKGLSKEDAQKQYIELVEQLRVKCGPIPQTAPA